MWAVGSDINKINDSIKIIGSQIGLGEDEMDKCLKSEKSQDEILNQRIEAQKKYKIESTPTVIINDKKYTGKVDYSKFKKQIEKNLVKYGLFK
jgi:protein-disulfide isomerase